MRFPIALVAAAALAPVLVLTACSGGVGSAAQQSAQQQSAAQSAQQTSAVSAASTTNHLPATVAPTAAPTAVPTAVPTKTPAPVKTKAPTHLPVHPANTDPVPPSPRSTGLIHVTTWKGTPAAKTVYVDSTKIIAYAPDGHVQGTWVLPGNLPSLVSGLTTAFGHSPLATVNGTAGWKYTWDGFVIYDDTPELVGPTDPAYQYDVTTKYVDGVLVKTVGGVTVDSSGTLAHAIASAEYWPGSYVAELDADILSVPAGRSPVLWTEAQGGATIADPITEIRGPVASWLS